MKLNNGDKLSGTGRSFQPYVNAYNAQSLPVKLPVPSAEPKHHPEQGISLVADGKGNPPVGLDVGKLHPTPGCRLSR